MHSDRDWNDILKRTNFEFNLDTLKRMLDEETASELYAWLDKWKANMLQVTALRMAYADEFIAPCDLDPSDERYNPDDEWKQYAPDDACDRVKRAAEIINSFKPLEEHLPLVHFTGDAISECIEKEKALRALEQ